MKERKRYSDEEKGVEGKRIENKREMKVVGGSERRPVRFKREWKEKKIERAGNYKRYLRGKKG